MSEASLPTIDLGRDPAPQLPAVGSTPSKRSEKTRNRGRKDRRFPNTPSISLS